MWPARWGGLLSIAVAAATGAVPGDGFAAAGPPIGDDGERRVSRDGRARASDLDGFDASGDRDLPEVVDFRVLEPLAEGGRGELNLAREKESDAIRVLLGLDWRIDRRGGAGGAVVLIGPGVAIAGSRAAGAGVSRSTGGGPEWSPRADAVRRLLADLPQTFGDAGAEGCLEIVYDRSSGPSRTVRFRQLLEGAPVKGAEIAAHFDAGGRLVMLASSYRRDPRPVNRRAVPAEQSIAIAREGLAASVAGIAFPGAAAAESWLWPSAGGLIHVWRVRHATRRPLGTFETIVDAQSGAVLSSRNLADRSVRNGKGRVFRENADYPFDPERVKLTRLLDGAENPEGALHGESFRIVDARGEPVRSNRFAFLYDPWAIDERDPFDQVNAYYHLERAHARFKSRFGVEGAPWFDGPSIPVIVNADDPDMACSAFYTPDLLDYGSPGFAFGNQNSCGVVSNEDLARDADVIYHEYTHGVVDWLGIDLGDAPVDSYQRSINEAVADYHAASFTGDSEVGEVFGYSRDLRNINLYPIDVGCWHGLMEEHCTGQIWGGLLWDVRSSIKSRADSLVFSSLDFMMDNWPSGHTADEVDFWDAAVALLDVDRALEAGRYSSLIYGAAASRGILGLWPFPGDNATIVYQNFQGPGKLNSVGWLHRGGWHVSYFFRAPVGSTVSIRVTSSGELRPHFALYEGTNGYDQFPLGEAEGVSASEARFTTVLPFTLGVYTVDVSSTDDTLSGPFKILITVH